MQVRNVSTKSILFNHLEIVHDLRKMCNIKHVFQSYLQLQLENMFRCDKCSVNYARKARRNIYTAGLHVTGC
jgi:hypothetical protein